MREPSHSWHEANQLYLTAALAEVREILRWHSAPPEIKTKALNEWEGFKNVPKALEAAKANMTGTSSLESLSRIFNLSSFEQKLLLLCAGMELDTTFAPLCAAAQDDPQRDYPTFSLALAALPDPHWSALSPDRPLRYWRLIEINSGTMLTTSPLRIDERILHFLKGWHYIDERLASLIEPVPSPDELVSSHQELAERLVRTWEYAAENSILPVVMLFGDNVESKNAIAGAAASMVGFHLHRMSADVIPLNSSEADAFFRLWEREEVLNQNGLLLDCDEADFTDTGRSGAISKLIDSTNGVLIVTARNQRQVWRRSTIVIEVHKPIVDEQRAMWTNALGKAAKNLNGEIEAMVTQFNLSKKAIYAACAEAFGSFSSSENNLQQSDQDAKKPCSNILTRLEKLGEALWEACRMQARPLLSSLAQQIHPLVGWHDLVLPDVQKLILKDITVHARQKIRVYDNWGFAAKSARGLGISALFAGASGTGKTMAAEVIAQRLDLDLYRIDLSAVVSKYIGETEKNLRRIFDAAESGSVILLFDEADALFGKRSEVRDSHDRYANIEISYLLQKMEEYRGLAILTSNMGDAIDSAFLRRLRFIVRFPLPGTADRLKIWEGVWPENVPRKALDYQSLARLNIAGGNIRNIALQAAFLAAETGESVSMDHLRAAAEAEYAKLEKTLTTGEKRGWI